EPTNAGPLAAGSHTFTVTATDTAGNTGNAGATWTIDTTAPTVTISSQPANPTNQTTASFSFSSSKTGSTFQCKLDGGSNTTCSSPTSYTGLAAGSHTFTVTATDPAGNTGNASATWTIDTTAPTVTITAQPANPTNSTSASFSFTSSKTGSTFQCKLDGGTNTTCTSPTSYTGLAAGSHTFTVTATDPAGNTGNATATWTIDTTAPDTTITASPPSSTSSTSASFSFTATETGSTFQCQLDGGAWTACTSPQSYTGLAAGNHVFQVKATDAAGNTDATPASFSWTITSPPTVTAQTPAPGATIVLLTAAPTATFSRAM